MKLVKCPRCELNYIYEGEKICSVCKRDVKGEVEQDDMIELCSECGEHPVIPGQEICVYCMKEMQRRTNMGNDDSVSVVPDEPNLNIDSLSTMDEITIDSPDGEDVPFDDADESFGDEDDENEDDENENDEDDDDDEDED